MDVPESLSAERLLLVSLERSAASHPSIGTAALQLAIGAVLPPSALCSRVNVRLVESYAVSTSHRAQAGSTLAGGIYARVSLTPKDGFAFVHMRAMVPPDVF